MAVGGAEEQWECTMCYTLLVWHVLKGPALVEWPSPFAVTSREGFTWRTNTNSTASVLTVTLYEQDWCLLPVYGGMCVVLAATWGSLNVYYCNWECSRESYATPLLYPLCRTPQKMAKRGSRQTLRS